MKFTLVSPKSKEKRAIERRQQKHQPKRNIFASGTYYDFMDLSSISSPSLVQVEQSAAAMMARARLERIAERDRMRMEAARRRDVARQLSYEQARKRRRELAIAGLVAIISGAMTSIVCSLL